LLKALAGIRRLGDGRSLIGLGIVLMLVTLVLQHPMRAPAWPAEAPADFSSSGVAAAGAAWAMMRGLRTRRLLRTAIWWLLSALALLVIATAELSADEIPGLDFRVVIGAWAAAALVLYVSTRSYATRLPVRIAMWIGLGSQAVAHLTWWATHPTEDSQQWVQQLIDFGELLALFSYFSALMLATASGLDRSVLQVRWRARSRRRPQTLRVCFPYIAQRHQILHSLPIAAAMARQFPHVEVHVASARTDNLDYAAALARRHAADAPLHYTALYASPIGRLAERLFGRSKRLLLRANRHYLTGFDAIVVPERTSTCLKKMGIAPTRLVGTEHGSGDREVTFCAETALYDFLLLPGDKQAERLQQLGHTGPGRFHAGVYAKYDWTEGSETPKLRCFDNDRPTVLYNPHFSDSLSSWNDWGWQLIDWFAAQDRYNLIVAPHMRLFHPAGPRQYAAFERYRELPHILIDLGSDRCTDMSYTRSADLYLGDVSSQVVEFLMNPRPCVFLNPRSVDWQNDLHYRFWHLGAVINRLDELPKALQQAVNEHPQQRSKQADYLNSAVGTAITSGHNGERGAQAIIDYLGAGRR